jgi:hypothetical protein
MSTADAGISIDPASVVVAAAVAAACFLKCRDKKKRAKKEELHGNVFDMRLYKLMNALALVIFGVHTK